MNGAHWHLVVNHLPIIFPIVGVIVMITGLISKSDAVKRTAFMIFIIGALTVQSQYPNIFDEELVDTFQTLANQLAVAIDNIQRLEKTQRQALDQKWLHEMGSKLHQTRQVEKIIEIGLQSLSERVNGAPIGLRLGVDVSADEPSS